MHNHNLNEGKEKLNELEKVIENAKAFATQEGVSKHSNIFSNEAILHEKEAKKWLGYTRNILIAIAFIAGLLTFIGIEYKENIDVLQFSITKIIILSTLFYGLSITNRNYKAHKHNALLNKHRQNALSTFETFSNASSADDQTKNAVLIETTRSIFSSHQTGYLKPDNDTDSNNKIIEIIKGVSSKG